jgi:hypothetical protein
MAPSPLDITSGARHPMDCRRSEVCIVLQAKTLVGTPQSASGVARPTATAECDQLGNSVLGKLVDLVLRDIYQSGAVWLWRKRRRAIQRRPRDKTANPSACWFMVLLSALPLPLPLPLPRPLPRGTLALPLRLLSSATQSRPQLQALALPTAQFPLDYAELQLAGLHHRFDALVRLVPLVRDQQRLHGDPGDARVRHLELQ